MEWRIARAVITTGVSTGDEKMDKHGRVRLNITRNSKGFGYDFTIEEEDADPEAILLVAEQFMWQVELKIEGWTLELQDKQREGA